MWYRVGLLCLVPVPPPLASACCFNKPHIREPSVDSPQFLARIGEGLLLQLAPQMGLDDFGGCVPEGLRLVYGVYETKVRVCTRRAPAIQESPSQVETVHLAEGAPLDTVSGSALVTN